MLKNLSSQKNQQQPVIDVIVVLVALPTLTILALLLEAATRGNWLATTQSRFTVLGLGIALAVSCLAITMYITSRIGGKMWSGAIPSEPGSGPSYSYYVSQEKSLSKQFRDDSKLFRLGFQRNHREDLFSDKIPDASENFLIATFSRKLLSVLEFLIFCLAFLFIYCFAG